MSHVKNNSGENEWYTPPFIIDLVKYYFVNGEIDLDPASSDRANKVVGARHYITKEQDALGCGRKMD